MSEDQARILIVDDDPDLIDRMTQLLEDDYDVHSTSDWSKLSGLVYKSKWDLILMDVHLPTLKGDKLVEILKRGRPDGGPKIYYFSSEDEDTLARLAAETGAAGYLSKSLRAGALLSEIQSIVRR